ncbi:hypothetical protein GCM10009827_007200 [Dactylosporangium maewongense]|uniref:Uncharacterized protein n=1 Tax=Dactylosporangium maewongense TaxID=634393 RepID=A0ABP4KB87_9ACTN
MSAVEAQELDQPPVAAAGVAAAPAVNATGRASAPAVRASMVRLRVTKVRAPIASAVASTITAPEWSCHRRESRSARSPDTV